MRALSVACALVLSAAPVAADNVADADAAFRAGRDLVNAGDHAGACAKFKESDRLDPQAGARFNIGLCEEKQGHIAAALAIFEQLQMSDPYPPRRARAEELVKALLARVPRIVLTIEPASAEIQIDGAVVVARSDGHGVELGAHDVQVSAPGYAPWRERVELPAEGARVNRRVTLQPIGATTTTPTTPTTTATTTAADTPSPMHRRVAIAGLVAGGAVLVGSLTFGLLARSSWNQAREVCGGTVCEPDVLAEGNRHVDDARSRALIANVLAISGGALAVTGAILWVTQPRTGAPVTARVGSSSATLVYTRTF